MARQQAASPAAQQRIKDVLQYGQKALGRANYLRYLNGQSLPASKAIEAFCYHCEGDAADGTYDCRDFLCSLYPWHPYKTVKALGLTNTLITETNGKGLVCSDVANLPQREDDPEKAVET